MELVEHNARELLETPHIQDRIYAKKGGHLLTAYHDKQGLQEETWTSLQKKNRQMKPRREECRNWKSNFTVN